MPQHTGKAKSSIAILLHFLWRHKSNWDLQERLLKVQFEVKDERSYRPTSQCNSVHLALKVSGAIYFARMFSRDSFESGTEVVFEKFSLWDESEGDFSLNLAPITAA